MFGRFKRSAGEMVLRGFQGRYISAGERGFAVLIERDDHLGIRWLIQSRAVAKQDQDRLKIASADVAVALVTETGLAFCPWCGVNLKRFHRKRVAELDRPGFSIPLPRSPP